jgi:hypothetical protein
MALKHGYATAEEYKKDALQKFSLVENGILNKPSSRLLLVNVSGLFLLRFGRHEHSDIL